MLESWNPLGLVGALSDATTYQYAYSRGLPQQACLKWTDGLGKTSVKFQAALIITLAACAVVIFAGTAAAADPAQPAAGAGLGALAHSTDFFPIVAWDRRDAWRGPERSLDGGLRTAADCHFSVAGFVMPEDIPECERLGLAAIVAPSEAEKPWFQNWRKLSDDDIDRGVRRMVEKSGNGKAVLGYTIMDEPGAAAFPKLAKAVAAVKKYAPGKLAHINLYPNYATLGAPDTSQLGAPTYREYLERFVKQVQPQFLCYDNYMVQFSDDMQDAPKAALYYANLLDVRQVAHQHHLPFWTVACCNQIRRATPVPSPANLAFQAYTALAAGSKGLTWFKYHQDAYAYAPIDKSGHKTETWQYLQTVNRQTSILGPIMGRLESTGVYFTFPPPTKSLPLLPGRIIKQVQSRATTHGTARADSPPVMVGEFTDEHGADYVMLVNLSLTRSTNLKLETIRTYKSKQTFSAQDGRLLPLDEQNGLWLVAGQGILVKLE
jgi:hypothetical protein